MLTVLIATRNRAKILPEVLDAYCRVQAPSGGWKLLIVDNGSTDATEEIIRSFLDRLPLTYLLEPAPGKSAALNTGLASIEGDLVVLTDDDTLPRFDWLKELRFAADSHPSFSVFGGQMIPRWEVQPEPWILAWVHLGPVFALTDPSWEEGPILPGNVFGGNMAIRARIFEEGYRFNTAIGPRGDSYAMGDDTDLTMRLDKAGFHPWHCKKAVVEHMVLKYRVDREWIIVKAVRFGRGQYRIKVRLEQANPKTLFGFLKDMARIMKEVVKSGLRAGYARLLGDEARTFKKRWDLNFWIGQLIEAWRIHKEP